jgi:hypothetical protein
VADALLYTWYSPGRNPTDSQQWYGIDSPSGATNADTGAFAVGVRGAAAARTQRGTCR